MEFFIDIPCWLYFLAGEFLLHIPCWLHFYLGSFSYTSRAGFIFMRGVSLTHAVLPSVLYKEFLLHTPCWLLVFFFFFSSFLHVEFFLLIPCWFIFYRRSFSYTCRAGFIFIWGVSLTHPLASFLSGEFALQIPRWFHFHAGSFSYTSCAVVVVVVVFKSHAGFFFNRWSFSYTFRVGFIFLWGVSLTHPIQSRRTEWQMAT